MSVLSLVIAISAPLAMRPPAAHGEDVDSLIRQGVELRRQGKDRDALALFQRAAEIGRTPRVLAQMALTEQALGLWVKAEEHLKAALETPSDPWIRKNRKTLDESMATIRDSLGTLEVWGEPAAAEVQVNGEPAGTLPATGNLRVAAGPVVLTVKYAGFDEYSRTLELKRGDFVRHHVNLRPLPPVVAEPPKPRRLALDPPQGSGGAGAVPPGVAKTEAGGPAETSAPIYTRWWFWTIVGAVAIGGGATAYLLTRPKQCEAGVTCASW